MEPASLGTWKSTWDLHEGHQSNAAAPAPSAGNQLDNVNMRGNDTIDQMTTVAKGSEGKQVRYGDLVEDGERATRIALGW